MCHALSEPGGSGNLFCAILQVRTTIAEVVLLVFNKDTFDNNESVIKLCNKCNSFETKKGYCYALKKFCRKLDRNPDEIIKMKKKTIEAEIELFLGSITVKRTRLHKRAALKRFFNENGRNNLNIPKVIVRRREPPQRPEYPPKLEEAWKMVFAAGSLRNQVIIMFLFMTGLRTATLRVLKYADVTTKELWLNEFTIKNEIFSRKKNLAIIIFVEMKKIDPNACKYEIPYYVFTPLELTEKLKIYIMSRKRKKAINDESFLFASEYRKYSKNKRKNTPISCKEIQTIVKNAAINAGLKNGQYVTPKALRKTFNEILRNQHSGSEMIISDQEFFMGHLLPGTQDSYYIRDRFDEMREKFSKLKFNPNSPSENDLFYKKITKIYGIDYDKVVKETEKKFGKEPTEDEILDVLKKFIIVKKKEQKIINLNKLNEYINKGWSYINHLPDGTAIIEKSG